MGGKGVKVEDGGGWVRGNTASSKNSKFFKKKKSKQNKTHTQKMNTSSWTEEEKKYVNDAGFKGEHEELCWDLWT